MPKSVLILILYDLCSRANRRVCWYTEMTHLESKPEVDQRTFMQACARLSFGPVCQEGITPVSEYSPVNVA